MCSYDCYFGHIRREISIVGSSSYKDTSYIRLGPQPYDPISTTLMGIPDHLTCLSRNLYAGQEATIGTGHGTTDWFQIGKGVRQACILSPCLFNLYAEYIMRNAGLEEAEAGIKAAGRNINNLRYETTPPLWQKVKKN